MQYNLRKASDYSKVEVVEIETIEDLKALQDKHGQQLIIDFKYKEIVVYDDYVE